MHTYLYFLWGSDHSFVAMLVGNTSCMGILMRSKVPQWPRIALVVGSAGIRSDLDDILNVCERDVQKKMVREPS